jgi:hypothetical protein
MAKTLLENGWTPATNSFWSPLYAWLLAVPMSLRLLSTQSELLWVHVINLGIFFLAMFCFHVLMTHGLRFAAIQAGSRGQAWARIETLWYFTACAIFLFAIFEWLPNALCTPDLLVGAFILLAAGFLTAIVSRARSWLYHFLLGAALGLGYLAKAPAFPLAVLFGAILLFACRREESEWAKCLLSFAAFALFAGPFLFTLSKKEGHVTFGDSGRVAFLTFGDGLPAYWLGEDLSPEANNPSFLKVCSDPTVIAFPETPSGIYFPSWEPSRWYSGFTPQLRPKQEAQNLRAGLKTLGDMGALESDLILGLVLLLFIPGWSNGLRSMASWWFLWLPAICGAVMFLVVHVEERFIAPFVIIGFVGCYFALLVPAVRKPRLVTRVLLAILLVQSCRAAIVTLKEAAETPASATVEAAKIVDALKNASLPPGSRVAVIGDPEAPYWAWVGQYSLVAEVPVSETDDFLTANDSERRRYYECLEKAGAQAAMFHADLPQLLEPGWQKMGSGNLYMRRLDLPH